MMIETGRSTIEERLVELGGRVERAVESYCSTGPDDLVRAMRYSVQAGGKRIRPVLTLLACEACGGSIDRAMVPAAAVEMVHTFSLIHDDLPAMDDDDLRRGQPTSHKVFGEAMAILAGDAMLIRAFELLAEHVAPVEVSTKMVAELARASGPAGMTGGQVLDVQYDAKNAEPAVVEQVHLLKTAALIRCAGRLGALAAGADESVVDRVGTYGQKVGLAYQIDDDLLDVVGERATMGKQTGKDAEAGRPNYAVLVGVDCARSRAAQFIAEAVEAVEPLGPSGRSLIELAQFVHDRQK